MSEHRLDEILIERPRGGMRISSRRLPGGEETYGSIDAGGRG